ncbi:MAG: glutamate--tRNA ligase [Pseudomonadota bacterium]
MIRTRFAPSPTGMLHIGNARTAILTYLAATKLNGEFWLRIDDTDQERSSSAYERAIKDDLTWLGLKWHDCFSQSQRLERYNEVKAEMIASGLLYPCFESKTELDLKRKILLSRNLPPIYDRSALKLTKSQQRQLMADGVKPHYRFKLRPGEIKWRDLVRGEIKFDAEKISDPVVIRADGSFTYLLCTAIDDADYKMTHIIRGEDHIANTAIQIQMMQALAADTPEFAHMCMMTSKEGKISKRIGGFEISSLRESGISSMAISSLLAKIGTSDSIKPYYNITQLTSDFEFSKCSRASVQYDLADLELLNHKYVTHADFNNVQAELEYLGLTKIDAEFWQAVRGNIDKVGDVKLWHQICHGLVKPVIAAANADYIKTALQHLPAQDNSNPWQSWTNKLKEVTDRKGKQLFMPLRTAITGLNYGPEMPKIIALTPRDKILKRLAGETA